METNRSNQSSTDDPNPKRQKLETDASTSSKSKINDDCPIVNLPADILAKIIAFIPVAQWPALESLYDFREATLIAWRQLRNINVERELLIKCEVDDEDSDSSIPDEFVPHDELLLRKLVERSPYLTTISLLDFDMDIVALLAKFENLQSISLGDQGGIRLNAVVEFLDWTRSRASLKELKLFNVCQAEDRAAFIEQFVTSFISGEEIHSPFKLETFSFMSRDRALSIRLDTMDTSRLTDIRLGNASIEPQQLTRLIERASNLRRIDISFMNCVSTCDTPRQEANLKVLTALASHKCLTAVKFDCFGYDDNCQCTRGGEDHFIEMLKTIGRRGQIRKLALEEHFVQSSNIDMNEICATIRKYIPYLQSIKVWVDVDSEELVANVVGLVELREIYFTLENYADIRAPTDVIDEIAPLSHLERLALNGIHYEELTWSKFMSAVSTSLTDLRVGNADLIRYDFFEKLIKRLASNLQILMLAGFGGEFDEDEVDGQEDAFVRLVTKAVRLRVLILNGNITDRLLMAIKSCTELEILGVTPMIDEDNQINVQQRLQDIVDCCPRLKRLGGFAIEVRNKLKFPKYRKIGDVDVRFWNYDFDSDEYD